MRIAAPSRPGFIVAVVMVDGAHGASSHAVLGFLVFTGAMLQPLNAAVRPKHGAPYRSQWEVLHKAQGHLLWAGGAWVSVLGAHKLDKKRETTGDLAAPHGLWATALVFASLWSVLFLGLLAKGLFLRTNLKAKDAGNKWAGTELKGNMA